MYRNIVKYVDRTFEIFVIFLFVFLWAKYALRSLWLSLIISVVLTLVLSIAILNIQNSKLNKKLLTKKQLQDVEKMQLFFEYSSAKHILDTFVKECKANVIKDNMIEYERALYFVFTNKMQIDKQDFLEIIKHDINIKSSQINIICGKVSNEVLDIASKVKNKSIVFVDAKKMVVDFKFNVDNFKADVELKEDKKFSFVEFLKLFLRPENAKGYLICAIVLMFSTLIIRQKIYYYIFISVLLLLSLLCKIYPKIYMSKK